MAPRSQMRQAPGDTAIAAGAPGAKRPAAAGGARALAGALLFLCAAQLSAEVDVYLLDVPDYHWEYGCFGTACGNLAGFWDRNGCPGFYTGPTAGGVAPMTSWGANGSIRSIWASEKGFDGRPPHQLGHVDDYWIAYESTAADPYVTAGRAEHVPDCIGDFIGLNQKKWTSMNGECDGNIDGYSFNYWQKDGLRRVNFQPTAAGGAPVPDIQSGLRAWTRHRGLDAEVFSQLSDFNPTIPPGRGFTFADLRREIDSGYPVLLCLQEFATYSRRLGDMPKANPELHGMLAYGYQVDGAGQQIVRYRTSWGSGDYMFAVWSSGDWETDLPLRGVIGYHPVPRITSMTVGPATVTITWEGPGARLYDAVRRTTTPVHRYVVEMSSSADPAGFTPITGSMTEHQAVIPRDPFAAAAFYRVSLAGE